jgi:hypothetical protein
MWPTSRILAIAGFATVLGGTIGGWFVFIGMILQQLAMPSGTNFGFAVFLGVIGAIVGLFVGLAASAGAVVTLYAIRRLPMGPPFRAALVAVVAASAALLLLNALGPFMPTTATVVTITVLVGLIAFIGIWLCERRQLWVRMALPVA